MDKRKGKVTKRDLDDVVELGDVALLSVDELVLHDASLGAIVLSGRVDHDDIRIRHATSIVGDLHLLTMMTLGFETITNIMGEMHLTHHWTCRGRVARQDYREVCVRPQ